MAPSQGFGPPKAKKKRTESAKKRKQASSKYDSMQSEGYPEFNIFIRDASKPNKWFPVGSMAVQRSSAIDAAIFQNETDLLKGALRLFPRLNKCRNSLEYGYRLKDALYADEPITVAKAPAPKRAQNLVKQVGSWIKSQLKRS